MPPARMGVGDDGLNRSTGSDHGRSSSIKIVIPSSISALGASSGSRNRVSNSPRLGSSATMEGGSAGGDSSPGSPPAMGASSSVSPTTNTDLYGLAFTSGSGAPASLKSRGIANGGHGAGQWDGYSGANGSAYASGSSASPTLMSQSAFGSSSSAPQQPSRLAGATSSSHSHHSQRPPARPAAASWFDAWFPQRKYRRSPTLSFSMSGGRNTFGSAQPGGLRAYLRAPRNSKLFRWVVVAAMLLLGYLWLSPGGQGGKAASQQGSSWWRRGPSRVSTVPKPPPKPTLPPKPPSPTSHSAAQLSQLGSSFSSQSQGSYSAVVYFDESSPAKNAKLEEIILSLRSQSHRPRDIRVVAPNGTVSAADVYQLHEYKADQHPILSIIEVASEADAPDSVLLVPGSANSLPDNYAASLLHAAGTKEYGAAIVTNAGLAGVPGAPKCLTNDADVKHADPKRKASSPNAYYEKTTTMHFPATAYLVKSAWLVDLSNGARLDLPVEVGIAANLKKRGGIPVFGIPISGKTSNDVLGAHARCQQLSEHATLFARSDVPSLASSRGRVALLLASNRELQTAQKLACTMAERQAVHVFLVDSEGGTDEDMSVGLDGTLDELAVPPMGEEGDERPSCHLAITPLKDEDTLAHSIVREFDALGGMDVIIYLSGSRTELDFESAAVARNGHFGGHGRQARAKKVARDGPTVIVLPRGELQYAEWMGTLPLESIQSWHTPQIDLTVITNNRPTSLSRLTDALQSAHYFNDPVSLALNLEQTTDQATLKLAEDFEWQNGPLTVRHRIVLGGLMPAIVESWYPSSNDSYGVILEDDVEVSPLFYAWLKYTILYYRYSSEMKARSKHMFGISLYQQKNVELRPEGRRPFDAHKLFDSLSVPPSTPYLSQVPCSWGAAYFPEVWREFHAYLSFRLSEVAMPISEMIVPEIKSNKWPRSWKKYFIELVYLRGYVMLYPNYDDYASFSTNHMEMGTHIHVSEVDAKRKQQFEVKLMDRNESLLELPGRELPAWHAMPIVDFWGVLATDEEVIERGWQTHWQLDQCPSFRLDVEPTYNAKELLCPRIYPRTNELIDARPLVDQPPTPAAPAVAPEQTALVDEVEQIEPPPMAPPPTELAPEDVEAARQQEEDAFAIDENRKRDLAEGAAPPEAIPTEVQ